MSEFDSKAFSDKVAAMFDDQLIALLSINSSHYIDDALQIARSEAERRGITSDIQQLDFDVFLNSAGFAGRLILLEEQLMFLSTGIRAGTSMGGGIIGSIAGEAHEAKRRSAAAQMDFSALDNEGSWIYFLDQIVECRVGTKLLSGPELQFVINEEDGSVLNGVVNCGDLSKSETEGLASNILQARDRFTSAS